MGRKTSYKIFEMDYLMNNDLSEDDLYYLFETSSLNYSLSINEFKYSNFFSLYTLKASCSVEYEP